VQWRVGKREAVPVSVPVLMVGWRVMLALATSDRLPRRVKAHLKKRRRCGIVPLQLPPTNNNNNTL
jgi:hypothetical protein